MALDPGIQQVVYVPAAGVSVTWMAKHLCINRATIDRD